MANCKSALRRLSDDLSPDSAMVRELVGVFRDARRGVLEFLLELHDASEDREFVCREMARRNQVWVAEVDGAIAGFIAFADGWVNQLYVTPGMQCRGIGRELLGIAKRSSPALQLWVFQVNERAIRFYEREGFRVIERTDGARNEAKRADARMEWAAAASA
jgi:ribosomal protein S18 acetylase RimI-like enzyme